MQATREEDRLEILAKIPNHEDFNAHLQKLLFEDLFPAWRCLDVALQLDRMGHMLRWHDVGRRRGTWRILDPDLALPAANPGAQIMGLPTEARQDAASRTRSEHARDAEVAETEDISM